jgi:hypothetical protein
MDEDLGRVRTAIERHKRRFGRRRMPEKLRTEARRLFDRQVASGTSRTAAAKGVGLPLKTLEGWELKDSESSFVPVEVAMGGTTPLVLTSPSGWRVEGLSLDDARHLLERLG